MCGNEHGATTVPGIWFGEVWRSFCFESNRAKHKRACESSCSVSYELRSI